MMGLRLGLCAHVHKCNRDLERKDLHWTKLELPAGDRLDLPRDTRHKAVVGPEGVACLEAHRR